MTAGRETTPDGPAVILCHTCGAVFLGDFRDSQDHALDQHPDTFTECWFTDLHARPEVLLTTTDGADRD